MFLGVGNLVRSVNGRMGAIVNGSTVEDDALKTAVLEVEFEVEVVPVPAAVRTSPTTQQADSHTHTLYPVHPQHVSVDHSRQRRHRTRTFHWRFGTYDEVQGISVKSCPFLLFASCSRWVEAGDRG